MYGNLVNVQVMAGVTVDDGVSSADAELTMYLDRTCDFIDDFLKGVVSMSLNPVPAVVIRLQSSTLQGFF
jgi:hypothetical protein